MMKKSIMIIGIVIIVSIVVGYYILISIENIGQEDTEYEIEFVISIQESPQVNSSFNVSCEIKNFGDNSINIFLPSLAYGSLDFYITTPDGKEIHYWGPVIRGKTPKIDIAPDETYSWTSIIGSGDGNQTYWGNVNSDGSGIEYYDFVAGNYEIKGLYFIQGYNNFIESNKLI